MDKKYINLNVGGTLFMCNRSTLTRCTPPNSPLHRISTNSTNVMYDRDEIGAYIIDRDPQYFQIILNYLRNRKLILPQNVPEEAILLEAEHFNITELIKILHQRITERNNQSASTALDYIKANRAVAKTPTMDPATLAKLATELNQFVQSI